MNTSGPPNNIKLLCAIAGTIVMEECVYGGVGPLGTLLCNLRRADVCICEAMCETCTRLCRICYSLNNVYVEGSSITFLKDRLAGAQIQNLWLERP